MLPEGAPELESVSRRIERHDLVDAHCHQPAEDHWRNRRIQFWRQTSTNSVDLDEASEWLPNGERSAEQQLLARKQVAQVWQAVKGLSERQRTVFLLRYVQEMELSEIAKVTGLSEGTVKAHLSRALGRVRTELRGTR